MQDLNPADINLDGCSTLNDLLELLSAYGDYLEGRVIGSGLLSIKATMQCRLVIRLPRT